MKILAELDKKIHDPKQNVEVVYKDINIMINGTSAYFYQ